jgi:outer membrane protein assembly factor BamB
MQMKRLGGLVTALVIVGIWLELPCVGQDTGKTANWPDFHGPGRSNISPELNLLRQWPEQGPRLLWTFAGCGQGYSGVTVAQGLIFTAGDFGKEERLLALDLKGKLVWQAPNGQAWRRSSPGSRATPTFSEGVLYHMNPLGRLAAYEAQSGAEIWSVDVQSRFKARYGIWAFAENVIVEGNKVLCMPGGSQGRVVALDKHTGKILWANTDIEYGAAYCSPVVVTHAGLRQWISLTQRSVVGVDVNTGKLLWSAPFVPRSPQNALTPVYQDGYVFIACGHSSGGTLLKIDLPGRTATTVWERQDLDDCHSGAFVLNGRLYGCACRVGGRNFFCVDFLTGRTIKQDSSLGKVGMTCASGMIYCLGHRGALSLLDITPDGFKLLSQFELLKKPTNAYLAHPVVCGGKLYIRCDQDLYAYDVSKQ